MSDLDRLLAEIRSCHACVGEIPQPRPVIQAGRRAQVRLVGQAPGTRVHASGKPFTDPSGDRLRQWLGIDKRRFYDPDFMAITPMGFCFPGLDTKGGDKPPRPRCARLWQRHLDAALPHIRLTILVGGHAQKFFLGKRYKGNVTDTVAAWREYGPDIIPLPHPSWRNNGWIRRHSWFSEELLPMVQRNMRLLCE
ncbi:uracil-DNA glycosylase family protein [Hyphobacterium sp. HN65]|uniref:Uracil-DNA glycosylase family protein n=1 Tax=Hyphobacterium lacteum TaxID=3116575 RepID=A0ABU7LTW7_9PROT|nr:uracil-DNA glycosylase family protein [Hyphobacterium sp. HN65]MEE2527086.1 uracil-DNA glycosylase family protein [Hyphobacterium sp. HN65]